MPASDPTLNRALGHLARGELTEPAAQLRILLTRSPSHPQAHLLAAVVHLQRGDPDLALDHARSAVRFDPANPFAHSCAGRRPLSQARLCRRRRRLQRGALPRSRVRGRLNESRRSVRGPRALRRCGAGLSPRPPPAQPPRPPRHHQHRPPPPHDRPRPEAVDLVALAHAAPGDPRFQSMLCASPSTAPSATARNSSLRSIAASDDCSAGAPRPSRCASGEREPLHIGYISPDFRTHSVAYFIRPILACHDRSRFKVHCYSTGPVSDAMTEQLRPLADVWWAVAPLDDAPRGTHPFRPHRHPHRPRRPHPGAGFPCSPACACAGDLHRVSQHYWPSRHRCAFRGLHHGSARRGCPRDGATHPPRPLLSVLFPARGCPGALLPRRRSLKATSPSGPSTPCPRSGRACSTPGPPFSTASPPAAS